MADFGAEIHDKTSIRYIDTGTQAWRAQPKSRYYKEGKVQSKKRQAIRR